MTSTSKWLSAIAALAMLATGCSKDNNPGGGNGTEDKGKAVVQLSISTEAAPRSRAATQNGQVATTSELTVDPDKGLTVVVFSETGVLEFAKHLDLEPGTNPGTYVTTNADGNRITVNAGNLYFYVFANNDPATQIAVPTGGNMEDFMTSELGVTYTGNDLNITVENEFLLGSMWRQTTLTPAGGTDDAAGVITVPVPAIGRLSAKVTMNNFVLTNTSSTLKGTYSTPLYRVGSVTNRINYVGVHKPVNPMWTGLDLPYVANTLVVSAAHEDTYDEDTYYFSNSAFTWEDIDVVGGTSTAPFYVTENTTAREAVTGLQHYGNTTYIQIQTKYMPDNSEVIDPATGNYLATAEGTGYTGGDFYTGEVNDERFIYSADPSAVTGIDVASIKHYVGGLNYHKFPIFDTNETDAVMKNRVLRNHYYSFDVTGIKDLGESTTTVEPSEPITEPTTIQVEVEVADWDKVATGNVEL